MPISPMEAAGSRSDLARRIIKKLTVAIDEELRVHWKGVGKTVTLRQDSILDKAKVDCKITHKIVDAIIEQYSKAGWVVKIDHHLSNSRWMFTSPENLNVPDDLIY